MADIYGMLDELQHRSAKEEDIKEKLLATRKERTVQCILQSMQGAWL